MSFSTKYTGIRVTFPNIVESEVTYKMGGFYDLEA